MQTRTPLVRLPLGSVKLGYASPMMVFWLPRTGTYALGSRCLLLDRCGDRVYCAHEAVPDGVQTDLAAVMDQWDRVGADTAPAGDIEAFDNYVFFGTPLRLRNASPDALPIPEPIRAPAPDAAAPAAETDAHHGCDTTHTEDIHEVPCTDRLRVVFDRYHLWLEPERHAQHPVIGFERVTDPDCIGWFEQRDGTWHYWRKLPHGRFLAGELPPRYARRLDALFGAPMSAAA